MFESSSLSQAWSWLFAALICLGLLLKLWLASRQIRHVARHRGQVPAPFASRISLAAHHKAADYTIAKLRLGVLEMALGTAVLVGWTLLGGLNALNQVLLTWLGGGMVQQLSLLVSFALIGGLLELPLSMYHTFVLEQRFGFNQMGWRLWVADLLKSTLVGLVLGLPMAALVLWLMAAAGALWWLWAWGAWVGLNLLLMVLLVWASAGSKVLFHLASLAGVGFWLLALLWLRFFNFGAHEESSARMFKLAAGTLAIIPAWAALLLLHIGSRESFDGTATLQDHLWLLTALAVVWAADSGAYFAGRTFGKHKLAPRVSPNKTIEGVLGGLVAGLVVAVGFGWMASIQPAQIGWLLLVAAVTVLASVLGDLFESLLKRHAGAKDSGNVIPGHGGVLDRIDGVLAALPVFVLGKEIFGF